MNEIYVRPVKNFGEPTHPYDYCNRLAVTPHPRLGLPPLADGGRPLIKA